MATFTSLPPELVELIVQHSVKEKMMEEEERRELLLNLSLVSRVFTRPSQRVLWSFIYWPMELETEALFMRSVNDGLANNIAVDELEFTFRYNVHEAKMKNLVVLLRSVTSVKRFNFRSVTRDAVVCSSLFSLPSLQSLQELIPHNIKLNDLEGTFPPTLQYASLIDTLSTRSFLNLILYSFSPSTSLGIPRLDISNGDLLSKANQGLKDLQLEYFKRFGSTLKYLTLYFFNEESMNYFLPYVNNLHSLSILAIRDDYSFQESIQCLSFLPNSVRLRELSIGRYDMEIYRDNDEALLPLFELLRSAPQLSKLQILRLYNNLFHDDGAIKATIEAQEEDGANERNFTELIKLCRERKIKISFIREVNFKK